MKKLLISLILLFLAAFPAKAESAYERIINKGVIRCGYALWPPFLDKDPNTGKLSGVNYDVFNAIAKEAGLMVEWTEQVGYGGYIEGLKTGRYDVMCQTVWPDPGRLKNSLLSIPAHYHNVYVVTRADDHRFDKDWKKLNDSKYKAAVIDGDITATIAKTDFPKMQVESLPQAADARQMLEDIKTGKADATFIDYGLYLDYEKQHPGVLKTSGKVLRVYGSVFSVNNEELMLKALIDNAIIALINNGSIEEILRRHPTTAMSPVMTYAPLPKDIERTLKSGK